MNSDIEALVPGFLLPEITVDDLRCLTPREVLDLDVIRLVVSEVGLR